MNIMVLTVTQEMEEAEDVGSGGGRGVKKGFNGHKTSDFKRFSALNKTLDASTWTA